MNPSSEDEKRILSYTLDGELKWSDAGASLPATISELPSTLQAEGRRYIESSGRGGLRWLNEDFAAEDDAAIDFSEVDSESYWVVRNLSDRTLVNGGWLIGFGAVAPRESPAGGNFLYGFVAQSLLPRSNDRVSTELLIPLTDKELYYRLGHPSVASIGNSVYFLALESTPRLYRVDIQKHSTIQWLRGLPGESTYEVPNFEERDFRGYGNQMKHEVYATLESFGGLPVGLYSHAGRLMVLYRPESPDAPWKLSVLKPKSTSIELEGELNIASDAAHFTIVSGPERIIMIEEGPVKEDGTQEIDSMIYFPSSWVMNPGDAPRVIRCGEPSLWSNLVSVLGLEN